MILLEEYLEFLQDAKRTSMARTTRQTKIKRATGQLATSAARKKNDPLYKRMIYHRDLWRKYKAQIQKKYAPRVRTKARR